MGKVLEKSFEGQNCTYGCTTNTREIWHSKVKPVTFYVDLNAKKKRKGLKFNKGTPCMECDKPRFIRGKLCNDCRIKLVNDTCRGALP